MNSTVKFNKNESGQAALEAAIILIAFVVVASVFAFAVLSAGSASTTRGEQAIYAGLQEVQSSMAIKGAVIATADDSVDTSVNEVVFTVALVSGGDPVNLDSTAADKVVVISYRDAVQAIPNLAYTVDWVVGDGDDLLEQGELAEITAVVEGGVASLTTLGTDLAANTEFSLEVKPPTGAVLQINRTTPAALEAVMELR